MRRERRRTCAKPTHQMREKQVALESTTDTVPLERPIARAKDVCLRSATISLARSCWLLALRRTPLRRRPSGWGVRGAGLRSEAAYYAHTQ